jgi:hypothetical protein
VIVPRFRAWYEWATVIAGDCLYIKRHMPERLDGKVIVTNTTTPADVEAFRQRGVRYLVTATPRLEGRSFGTNVMEAALVALAGKKAAADGSGIGRDAGAAGAAAHAAAAGRRRRGKWVNALWWG